MRFFQKIASIKILTLLLLLNQISVPTTAVANSTLLFSNSNGSFNAWNQGANSIYLNKITGVAGVVITTIRSGWASNVATQSPSNTVYLFSDVSGAPGSVVATFTYASNNGGNWASYSGNYTVPAGNTFFIGQRASIFINNAGGATSNQAGTAWSITYSNRYSGTSLTGPFTNEAIGSSPIWEIYGSSADTTAPTFTSSSSFSVAENILSSANAATIKVSESATVTVSAGADAASFNIITSDSITVFIRFKAPPDFEAPADVGGNNVYEIALTATDAATNAGTQSITITVTDVVDTSSFNSLALAGSATTATFRTVVVITANVSVASRVTFRVNGKVLPGCKNKLATGSGSSFSTTCNWRPSNRGQMNLTAAATPTGAGISSATANAVSIRVINRTGSR
jgi:hypothetical protein